MKVPGDTNVNKSLLALKQSLKECLAEINQEAGRFVSKGNYARTESLVGVAKSVEAFHTDVDALHTRWKEIKGQGRVKTMQTPLWEYYNPILRALANFNGVARIADLESAVGSAMKDRLTDGDFNTMARGRARWQAMIRKARKHMVKEGLLESGTGVEWKITPQGRKAAVAGKTVNESTGP